jgi:hypothetical protein
MSAIGGDRLRNVEHHSGSESGRLASIFRNQPLSTADYESLLAERGGLMASMAQATRQSAGIPYSAWLTEVEDELDLRFPDWELQCDARRITVARVSRYQ